jgi:general secretion pathway protein H
MRRSGGIEQHGLRAASGFTLLELLVVLAITAALMTIVPRALAGIPTMRFRAAAADMADAMRQAREDAIRTGRTIAFSVDTRQRSYSAAIQHSTTLPEVVDGIDATQDGPGAPDSVRTYRFFADGSATGGIIILHHGRQRAILQVAWLTGRVQVDD